VSAEGLEPSTNGLKGHCSAIELRARAAGIYPSAVHSITQNPRRQRCPPQANYRVKARYSTTALDFFVFDDYYRHKFTNELLEQT
jgi:hypothetical protein